MSAISDRGMTIAFGLPRPLKHPRIRKIEDYGGGWYGHWMRITSPKELDDETPGMAPRVVSPDGVAGAVGATLSPSGSGA